MAKFDIVTCSKCETRVIPKRDGTCPSCQAIISSGNSIIKETNAKTKKKDVSSKPDKNWNLRKANSHKSLTRTPPKLFEEVEDSTSFDKSIFNHSLSSWEEPLRNPVRRDPEKMHPIAMPLILVGYILTVIWVLWSTVIAFGGGKIPVFGWEINGGILLGLFWIGCLWPVVFGVTYLIFKLLDSILWWLDERLQILLSRSNKSAHVPHSPTPPDVTQLMQQSMPMLQNVSNKMAEITRDALAKGVPPETMVDILISKLGFSRKNAQTVVNNMVSEIHNETQKYEADSDVLLLESGLTQAVMADIVLGIDSSTTISTLVEVGMPEAKAKAFVFTLLETFMGMPNAEREEIRRNIKHRMKVLDSALSNGVTEEVLVQSLMEAEGFTIQQAEGIVRYCALVYRIRKP